MKSRKLLRFQLALQIALGLVLAASGATGSNDAKQELRGAMPLGYDMVMIRPSGAVVSMLALLECPELQGAQLVDHNGQTLVVSPDGEPLKQFPHSFSFRITASLRKTVLGEPNAVLTTAETPEDFLLKLRFRLYAYRGIQKREIAADAVKVIGVPADVSYDERIYRVSFSPEETIPASDRCVLEIISPEGERLTRFHFDLL